MEAKWRVLWDNAFHDWIVTCRPTSTQCFWVFNWVLDVIEHGPPDDKVQSANEGIWSYAIEEEGGITVFFLEWEHEPVMAVAEILSL